ncbi:MAG: SET domain-containing protein-lysine N-methyltransferase [Candidatus Lokiarchaeota archaeon]|nr:SET domain-containing protein-lysine N-methyltransferase [Candidatus Lokiarchaeota archaeon]
MHDYIEVKFISKKKGRGAFAKKSISKETVIDIANIVLLPNEDYKKIRKTKLYDYCYVWEDPKHLPAFKNAITLSVSQFINHSYTPNLQYLYDYEKNAIEYSAIRDILKGEELTVNYNGLVDDTSPIWFMVQD